MVGPFYYIRSALNPDLVLTLGDDTRSVVASWINLFGYPQVADLYQQWSVIGSDPNWTIINRGTGLALSVRSHGQGAQLYVTDTGDPWNLSSGGIANGSTALRPSWDFDLNASVYGGSMENKTQVVLWSWGGSNTDKIWNLQDVNTVKPFPTNMVGLSGSPHSALLTSVFETVTFDGAYPGEFTDTPYLWRATCWSTGMSFQFAANGQFLAYAADNAAVDSETFVMGIRALWTLAPQQLTGDVRPFVAMRPYLNSDMNLTTSQGGEANSTVNVDAWNDDTTQMWLMYLPDANGKWNPWGGC